MGDSDTWPAREAELLDIARDEGIDDPGNDPHMLPNKDCRNKFSICIFLLTCVTHSEESWNPFKENIILRTFGPPGRALPPFLQSIRDAGCGRGRRSIII